MLRKRWLNCTALALIMAMGLTACGESENKESSAVVKESESEKTSEATEVSEPAEDPLKISIITYNQSGYVPVDGTEAQKIVEERFNVEFEVIPVDIHNKEQYNLYFAQGGEADVMFGATTDMIDQGLVREISFDDLYEKMPTWMARLEELLGGNAEMVKNLSLYEGKSYYVPYTHGPSVESAVTLVRKDWMDKVGIDSVTSIEDFEALLDAFTYGDPDGNGVNDTYGINGSQFYGFNLIWGAYGMAKDSYYVENDEVIYSSITETYKEVLQLLNKWYDAGYIDPEFVTDDRTTQRSKWSEGKFGLLDDTAFWCDSLRGENGVMSMVQVKNENAAFEFMNVLEGPEGATGSLSQYPSLSGTPAMAFGANASDEVVYKMMEIKEAMSADWDLYLRCYYGVEGEDYTWEDGILVVNAEQTAEDWTEKGLRHTWAMIPTTFDIMQKSMNESDTKVHSVAMSQPIVYTGVTFSIDGVCESKTIKGEDVSKIVNEYYYNAIVGNVDIESTWESYVQRVLDAGMSDILAEYNEIRIR